jgi:transcription elongation factor GreA
VRKILDKLEKELSELEHEFRVELPREIKTAVAMGDLRENAEYHAALERQAFVRARISQLRERLGALNAISLDQVPRDRSAIGSRLELLDLDTDEEISYQLVFPEASDLDQGLLSIASPIGKALVGLKEGDEVKIEIPSGARNFEVLGLKTMHEQDEQE